MKNNKPTLNLLTFVSKFQPQDEAAIHALHTEMFEALEQKFFVRIIFLDKMECFVTEPDRVGETVVFMATGGTENMAREAYASLPHPTTLITDGKANSLAASMEFACWARQQGDECQIKDFRMCFGDSYMKRETRNEKRETRNEKQETRNETFKEGERIGVIGKPSDWLISSSVDYAAARERWGVEYVDIPLQKVDIYYNECNEETRNEKQETRNEKQEVTSEASRLISAAYGCEEPDEQDVTKALRLYISLKKIVEEYRLTALTIQCFSLIPTTCTTGCLALALLNDEGIVAGCEGDLQSIFTMLLAKRATGVDGFMANPSSADVESNRIVFAHCTIGLKQIERYILRSHFESGIGVAIQGIIPDGEVTIVKCGGKGLDKSVVLTGRVIDNLSDPNNCRTQILVELDDPIEYFFTRSIGNHHIILQGNHKAELERMLS